jgi:hypothetical protein
MTMATTAVMVAFHGDAAVKEKYLSRVRAHRKADELVQGTGWENGRGCAVGCTLESYEHACYPTELGIPEELGHLEDRLFELMSPEGAQEWPERFLDAITPGADLSRVWPRWAVWMLTDPEHGVQYAGDRDNVRAVIVRVSGLWERVASGETVAVEEFRLAAAAAWAASSAAAWAASSAAAWAAAAARAAAAAWAAEAWAAAASAPGQIWVKAASEKLIELLQMPKNGHNRG